VSGPSSDLVRELLTQSLAVWRFSGSVACAGDGAINVACDGVDIRIERAARDLPFRWMVTIGRRKRGAISLPAVLRQVREALDPGYASNKVRVALAHDPEKWEPVFGQDHAQTKSSSA
jgi:hypothetical protein